MSKRARPFQNPHSQRPYRPHTPRVIFGLQQEKNALKSRSLAMVEKAMDKRKDVERTLNPKTGRARYNTGGVLACVQMVDMLPWWRRLLILLMKTTLLKSKRYFVLGGVGYLEVGQTNILYRAQEWIAGRADKSFLEIVGSSRIPVINEPDLPKSLSDGTACEVE